MECDVTVTTTPETSPGRPASELRLERRREQLRRSRERLGTAETTVQDAESRLRALQATRQEARRRLQAAEQEVAAARKQLKRSAKEQQRLQEQRRKARKRSGNLAAAVRAAEDKYDKAVLADLVRREKDRDLAVHTAEPADQPVEPKAPSFPVVDHRETQRTGQIAEPDPEVVPADPAPAKVSGRTTTRATTRATDRAPARSRAAAAGTSTGGSTARTTRSRSPRQS
jgi:hypothetical protein